MGANLIHECKLNHVGKFIMLGTVCSYPKFTPVPFKESDFWNGYPEETNAPYGIAKKALVEMLIGYRKQYGLKSNVLVPCNMYGPHDHFNLTTSHVIPALIMKVDTAIKNNEPSIEVWGTGEASREFLYVDDCVDAIIRSIQTDTDSQPINIGTGEETKIADLITMICDIMGYSGDIVFDTTKPDGQPRRSLDVSRAKEILNFTAKTKLKEGLEKTIKWYKEEW
jgi:GDP-L-fucose synthase